MREGRCSRRVENVLWPAHGSRLALADVDVVVVAAERQMRHTESLAVFHIMLKFPYVDGVWCREMLFRRRQNFLVGEYS